MESVQQDVIDYYSKDVIAKAIAVACVGREAVGVYSSGHYDSRPNVIQFAADVAQLAAKGITSFHVSVERWRYPMQLGKAAMNSPPSASYDTLRTGWDFVLDIDSKLGLEESTIAAHLICELFEKYGIKKHGLKFSGRRGWHLCLPWESLPKQIDYKPAEIGYPEIPRVLSRFIRSRIAKQLMEELLKRRSLKEMLEALDVIPSELSPFFFVEVEQDWGARHLVRAPLSLNEKTWNVSLPIRRDQLGSFSPEMAKPAVVMKLKEIPNFFDFEKGSAEGLVLDALDWWATQKKEHKSIARKEVKFEQRISEDNFPPCIKLILAGIKDGKKRSLFTLINFLRFANWSWQDVEAKLFEWNSKNTPMLHRSLIIGQLRWAMQQNRSINPANCSSEQFYRSIGICNPDGFCKNKLGEITIKNPISYPFRKMGISRKTNSLPATQASQNTNSLTASQSNQDTDNSTSSLKAKSSYATNSSAPAVVQRNYVMRGFSCDECNREFKTMLALQSHKTRVHGG